MSDEMINSEINPKGNIFESKVVDDRIEVTSTENGVTNTYIFKIPSIRETTRMGVRERDLRMADSVNGNGSEVGIDIVTELLYRAMALFEMLLIKTSDLRLFSDSKDGIPIVDSNKFGANIDPFMLIGVSQSFQQALDSFRQGGNRS